MKLLLTIVLLVAAIYAGFWLVASQGLDRGLRAGIAAAEGQGWQIDTSDLSTGGFPSRFDVTATDLAVTSPDEGLVWRAPWVQSAALSYRPNKVIVALPPEQTVRIGRQDLDVVSTGFRASFSVAADRSLSFDALTAEAENFSVTSSYGWSIGGRKTLFALRPLGPAANTYEAYVDFSDMQSNLTLPSAPSTPAQMTVDATMVLDRPLDRFALLPTRPQITNITLNDLSLNWGTLQLTATGALQVDATGTPTGQMTLIAKGWEDLIGLLSEAGLVQPNILPTFKSMASLMSNGTTLTMPLTFANGGMALGPIPLGPAPRIALP